GGGVADAVGIRGGFADVVVSVGADDQGPGCGDRGQPSAWGVVSVGGGVCRRGLAYHLGGGDFAAKIVIGGLVDRTVVVGDGQLVAFGVVRVVRDTEVGCGDLGEAAELVVDIAGLVAERVGGCRDLVQ